MQPAQRAWGFGGVRSPGTRLTGSGAGWLFANPSGGPAPALALPLAGVLANLARLEWWLRHRSYADPPDIGGGWGEIISQIARPHPPNRFPNQRIVQPIRQFSPSTAARPHGVVILTAQRDIRMLHTLRAP